MHVISTNLGSAGLEVIVPKRDLERVPLSYKLQLLPVSFGFLYLGVSTQEEELPFRQESLTLTIRWWQAAATQ